VRFFRWYIDLFLTPRLYFALSGIALWWIFTYRCDWGYAIGMVILWLLVLFLFFDLLLLYALKDGISADRVLTDKLSNGDDNPVRVTVQNHYRFAVRILVIDELPVQFQVRNFSRILHIPASSIKDFTYTIFPTQRGVYHFGVLHVFVSAFLGFFQRRFQFQGDKEVKVYPSFIQMRRFAFLMESQHQKGMGLKKIRPIGQSWEFDRIKSYVFGDDTRNLNWKASAKNGALMVNQFIEEKSQPIYLLLDTGRTMKMPFDGLSLLDHAVNSTLAFANIALKRNQKVGMMTFSNVHHQNLKAGHRTQQRYRLSEMLYQIKTDFMETDFGQCYSFVKRKINQRSLLVLYTNFEHLGGLRRQMPYIQAINKQHVLLVVFFENPALQVLINTPATQPDAVFQKSLAQKFTLAKLQMVAELENHGVLTLLTVPEKLTVDIVNKYMEIKAKNLL